MPTKYLTRTLALSSTLAFAAASGVALAQQDQDQAQAQPPTQTEQQASSQQSMGGGEAGGSDSTTTIVGGEDSDTAAPPPAAGAGEAGGSDTAATDQPQPTDQAAAAGIEPVMDEDQLLELQGMTVVNAQGEEIGEVDSIVRDKTDQSLKAVVSSGGFLGMGGEKFAVSAEELQVQGDQVQLSTPMSQEEIQQAAASFDEQSYETLGSDTAVGGGEAGGTAEEEPQSAPSLPEEETQTQ